MWLECPSFYDLFDQPGYGAVAVHFLPVLVDFAALVD